MIAATHQDLEARVRAGQFREDLFHRLNVIRLKLPALRERPEDIALLAKHFLQKSAQDLKVETKQLSTAAMEVLVRLPFPGNVRQLENLCHWMTVMAPSQTVQLEDLPAEIRMPNASELQHVNGLSPSDSRVSQVLGSDPYRGGEVIASSSAVESPRLTPSWQELLRQEVSKSLAGQMPGPDHGRPASRFRLLRPRLAGDQRAGIDVRCLHGHDQMGLADHRRMNHWAREFESAVLGIALKHTRGRRMEAAQLLGIGRNTMTRKIADLHLEDDR